MAHEDQIETMIQQIIDDKTTEAGDTFNSVMLSKAQDALDLKKREIAARVFGGDAETSFESGNKE